MPEWQGSAYIYRSEEYAKEWKDRSVVALDSDSSGSLTQSYNFDGSLRVTTPKMVLSFAYGIRQGVRFENAKAKLYWNLNKF